MADKPCGRSIRTGRWSKIVTWRVVSAIATNPAPIQREKATQPGIEDKRGTTTVMINSKQHPDEKYNFAKSAAKAINTLYPSGWVVSFLIMSFFLSLTPDFCTTLAGLHDEYFSYLSITNSLPYSSDFGKAYVSILIVAMPIQFLTLLVVDRDYFFSSSMPGTKERGMIAAAFFIAAWFFMLFIIEPGTTAMIRFFGSGNFAVAIVAPIFTSALPVALYLYLLTKKNTPESLPGR